MNGKGDKMRPTDMEKYRNNYDKIFKKNKCKCDNKICCQNDDTECSNNCTDCNCCKTDIDEEWDQKAASDFFVKQLDLYCKILGV